MSYSTSNPPFKAIGGGLTGSAPTLWMYSSTDPGTTVDDSGYFTNGYDLGMRKGHLVFVLDNDSTNQQWTAHAVVSDTGGTIDLSDGVSIGGAANT